MVNQRCSGITLHDKPFLFHGRYIISYCTALVVWGNVSRSPDVHVFVLKEVPHIIIKQTILGHLKCWPLWDVDDKLISILDVVGHKIILPGPEE